MSAEGKAEELAGGPVEEGQSTVTPPQGLNVLRRKSWQRAQELGIEDCEAALWDFAMREASLLPQVHSASSNEDSASAAASTDVGGTAAEPTVQEDLAIQAPRLDGEAKRGILATQPPTQPEATAPESSENLPASTVEVSVGIGIA